MVAEKFAREGCNVAINYVANVQKARETVERIAEIDSGMVALIHGVSKSLAWSVPLLLLRAQSCSSSHIRSFPLAHHLSLTFSDHLIGRRSPRRLQENRPRSHRKARWVGHNHFKCSKFVNHSSKTDARLMTA